MKAVVVVLIIVLFFSFCVYSYKVRTNFNVDKLEDEIKHLEYQVSVLDYAFSLLPKENRTEVFYNSITEKCPSFKDDEALCRILGYEKTKAEN